MDNLVTKCSQSALSRTYGLGWDIQNETVTHVCQGNRTLCGREIRGENRGWIRNLGHKVSCKRCLQKLVVS